MFFKKWLPLFILSIFCNCNAGAQTWVDTMDTYARTAYLPAGKYLWTWQKAALLRSMTAQYEMMPANEKMKYLDYVCKAMNHARWMASGRTPNAVASGLGMAFAARITGEEKYHATAEKVYRQYMKIPRTENGGVTHVPLHRELWDDTVFMIGVFLQEMYRLTGDEKYMDELVLQISAHREKLRDEKWGLWVHGWDNDNKNRCNICGQTGWSRNPAKRSSELWGRGNGWVIVTLAQTIEILPAAHPKRAQLSEYLKEMIVHLPSLQDSTTGHWYQLPVRPSEPGNYIESSCTAMFAFGILKALKLGIVHGKEYEQAADLAYAGLRRHSIRPVKGKYLTTKNVCKGTCIGDMDYYLNRKAKSEKPSGIGMFILFGREYEAK